MKKTETNNGTAIELDGFEALRLLSAFQALQMPTKFYGITHKQARQIIHDLTGRKPKGKPPANGDLEYYIGWLAASTGGKKQ